MLGSIDCVNGTFWDTFVPCITQAKRQDILNVKLTLRVILSVETCLTPLCDNVVSGAGLASQVGEFVFCQQAMKSSSR